MNILNSSPDGIVAFKAVRNLHGEIAYFCCVLANSVIDQVLSYSPDRVVDQRLLKGEVKY